MKIGIKLTISFLLIAFLSMLVVGLISYHKAKESLQAESFNRLTAVREMKSNQIEDYFRQIHDQLLTFAEDQMIIDAMKDFRKGYNNIDAEMKLDYDSMRKIDPLLDSYLEREYSCKTGR